MIYYLLLLFINLFVLCILVKHRFKKNDFNDSNLLSLIYYAFKCSFFGFILNFILDAVFFIIFTIYDQNIVLFDIIFKCIIICLNLSLYVINYFVIMKKSNNKNIKIESRNFKFRNTLIMLFIVLSISSSYIYKISFLFSYFVFVCFLLLLTQYIFVIIYYFKNKNRLDVMKRVEETLYPNGSLSLLSEFILLFIFCFFVLANIPYAFFIYLLACSLLMFVLYKRILKINKELKNINHKRLVGNDLIVGLHRYINNTENFCLIVLMAVFTLIVSSGVGEYSFVFNVVSIYSIILFERLVNKTNEINMLFSLEKDLIDKKEYKLKLDLDVVYVKKIYMLDKYIYKLVCKDQNDNIYESSILFYEPELDRVKCYSKIDMKDYYISIEELYN